MAKTFLTIQTELSELYTGEAFSTLSSADQTQMKLRINLAKDYIANFPKGMWGRGWRFLETPAYIATTAVHTTGTLTLTQYSANVGAGDTAPVFTSGMVDRLLIVGSGKEPYRIKTFSDANNIILYTPYQGGSDTDASYSIVKDVYALPSGFNGIVEETLKQDSEDPMTFLSNSEFARRYPESTAIGRPEYYGYFGWDTSNNVERLWLRESYPQFAKGIEYRYYTTIADMTANGDITVIGYQQGGDNAMLLTSIWQLKEMAEDYTDQEKALAKKQADQSIMTLWENTKIFSENQRRQGSKIPTQITDKYNW